MLIDIFNPAIYRTYSAKSCDVLKKSDTKFEKSVIRPSSCNTDSLPHCMPIDIFNPTIYRTYSAKSCDVLKKSDTEFRNQVTLAPQPLSAP